MAERNTPDRRNLVPLAGSIVAGTGIIALAYKALFTKSGEVSAESEDSLAAAPAAAAAAAPVAAAGAGTGAADGSHPENEDKEKPKWPCTPEEPESPCSNPYSRRTPYCQ